MSDAPPRAKAHAVSYCSGMIANGTAADDPRGATCQPSRLQSAIDIVITPATTRMPADHAALLGNAVRTFIEGFARSDKVSMVLRPVAIPPTVWRFNEVILSDVVDGCRHVPRSKKISTAPGALRNAPERELSCTKTAYKRRSSSPGSLSGSRSGAGGDSRGGSETGGLDVSGGPGGVGGECCGMKSPIVRAGTSPEQGMCPLRNRASRFDR